MKKGKFTSLMLAGMMAVTTLAGCGSGGKQAASKVDTSEAAQGKVLNIYCWNTEFQDRFEYFKKSGKLPSDVKVNFVVTPNENNAYQNALDAALLKQNDVPADEKIDIFLIEADYALKYVDSDYTLDVVNDIGLSKDALADQYQYTKDIVTDSKGVQKGTTWQATPGLFAYRRSIAKDVLGTDDPDAVQAQLSSWDKFNAVAEKASEKGYKMLSGYDDAYRVFSNNVSAPCAISRSIVPGRPIVLMPSAASFCAPWKDPSPPITTIASIPCFLQISAPFCCPSAVTNSLHLAVCKIVPPREIVSETLFESISTISSFNRPAYPLLIPLTFLPFERA